MEGTRTVVIGSRLLLQEDPLARNHADQTRDGDDESEGKEKRQPHLDLQQVGPVVHQDVGEACATCHASVSDSSGRRQTRHQKLKSV